MVIVCLKMFPRAFIYSLEYLSYTVIGAAASSAVSCRPI